MVARQLPFPHPLSSATLSGSWCRVRSWAVGRRKILKVQDRRKLFDILADEDSLIRHYSVSAADRPEIAFAVLLAMFDPARSPGVAELLAATGASYLLGYLAVFAPGGIGVREAALATALSATTGAPAALGAAVALRLVEAALEVVLVLGTQTFRWPNDSAGREPRGVPERH